MGNPSNYIKDPQERQKAQDARYEAVVKMITDAKKYVPVELVRDRLNTRVINTEVMRLRIKVAVEAATRPGDMNKNLQDVIVSPWNNMRGALPTRAIREKFKAEDEAINNFGQLDEDVGPKHNHDRHQYVVQKKAAFEEMLPRTNHEATVATLYELIEYVLIHWEKDDPFLIQLFEEITETISRPESQSFLKRLFTFIHSSNEVLHHRDWQPNAVLCELWWHIGENAKDKLRKVCAPWMTHESLYHLGNPLHIAALNNDAGMFAVLADIGVPLDTKWQNVEGCCSIVDNASFIGKTAFELAVDQFYFHTRHATVKAFTYYVDCQLRAIENKQALTVRQTRALEAVKQRGAAVPEIHSPRKSYYQFVSASSSGQATEVMSPRIGMAKKGWFESSKVEFRQETYGQYHDLRKKLLTALESQHILLGVASNMLNKGEFKAFMYFKWLGRIVFIDEKDENKKVKNLYLKECHFTGNTYLHYLVSHWDDPDYVSSDYERQMRLSAIVHVLYIGGDKAREARNKKGQTPWDMCDSDELKSILRYLNIDVSGGLYERMMAKLTREPASLQRIPTHLTYDALQFAERVYARTQQFEETNKDSLTALEKELIPSVLLFMKQHLKKLMKWSELNGEAGELVIMLQNKVSLVGATAPYTMSEMWKSMMGNHYLNQLDELLDDVLQRHNVDAVGKQGLADIRACVEAERGRKDFFDAIQARKQVAQSSDNNATGTGVPMIYKAGGFGAGSSHAHTLTTAPSPF